MDASSSVVVDVLVVCHVVESAAVGFFLRVISKAFFLFLPDPTGVVRNSPQIIDSSDILALVGSLILQTVKSSPLSIPVDLPGVVHHAKSMKI